MTRTQRPGLQKENVKEENKLSPKELRERCVSLSFSIGWEMALSQTGRKTHHKSEDQIVILIVIVHRELQRHRH